MIYYAGLSLILAFLSTLVYARRGCLRQQWNTQMSPRQLWAVDVMRKYPCTIVETENWYHIHHDESINTKLEELNWSSEEISAVSGHFAFDPVHDLTDRSTFISEERFQPLTIQFSLDSDQATVGIRAKCLRISIYITLTFSHNWFIVPSVARATETAYTR